MGRLDGKVAIITGAARGQGRSHALTFAREGADLMLCDIGRDLASVGYSLGTEEQLNGTAEECQAMGRRVETMLVDVRNADQVRAMVDRTIEVFGKIDILINNAGIASMAPVHDISEEMWDEMIDTNLKGAWLCMKYVIPHMLAQGSGRIISTSSGTVNTPAANLAHYIATKHGVVGLTRVAAQELGQSGITVNCVLPGTVDTPMIDGIVEMAGMPLEQGRELFANAQLDGTFIMPQNVSDAYLFLASDEASRITGVALAVDGGVAVKSPI